ncbi:30S ribosomal protein S3 [Candidatus Jorgensenbacteria bacterium]|nr:30S ribosomal protein S3 [Candidatus Jorgensenbacteria bacterium]
MAQKINPNSFRLGLTIPWSSRWFPKKQNRFFIEEDHLIRKMVHEKLLTAGIVGVDIERTGDTMRVSIKASRPGFIIGRGGKGIEDFKEALRRALRSLRIKNKLPFNMNFSLNIEELKRTEISAKVAAQQIAFELQKRLPYRGVLKRQLEAMMQNREVQGAKIKLAGRLNGAEIARQDWLARGRMPLQTLRANIDYGEATAFNSYGTVGIKVWLYKGEIFEEKKKVDNRK